MYNAYLYKLPHLYNVIILLQLHPQEAENKIYTMQKAITSSKKDKLHDSSNDNQKEMTSQKKEDESNEKNKENKDDNKSSKQISKHGAQGKKK